MPIPISGPTTITEPGEYELVNDIEGDLIIENTENVILNGNGYYIRNGSFTMSIVANSAIRNINFDRCHVQINAVSDSLFESINASTYAYEHEINMNNISGVTLSSLNLIDKSCYVYDAINCTFNNITLTGIDFGSDIGIYNSYDITLRDVNTNGEGYVDVRNTNNSLVENLRITGETSFVNCSDILVRNISVENGYYGIDVGGVINSIFDGIYVKDCVYGIYIRYSDFNSSNVRIENCETGVYSYGATNRICNINIDKFIIVQCDYGIYPVYIGHNVNLTNGKIKNIFSYGIYQDASGVINLENVEIENTDYGAFLTRKNSHITSCTFKNNTYGVVVSDGIITSSTFSNNNYGIFINKGFVTSLEISSCFITNNEYGICISGVMLDGGYPIDGNSDGNLIYNNYFSNNQNILYSGGYVSGNYWNIEKTPGKNIVGGPYIGGNYWGKPDGTGFSDLAMDSDGDGIADEPYDLYYEHGIEDIPDVDWYPLVKPKVVEKTRLAPPPLPPLPKKERVIVEKQTEIRRVPVIPEELFVYGAVSAGMIPLILALLKRK